MNIDGLKQLIISGESERLEFKRSTGSLRDSLKTLCALLNSSLGGFILFGVDDAGQLVGQDVSRRTMEEIANALSRIEPPAFPDVETITLENGRSVIVVRVSGGSGLYTCDGRPYHRVGPTTQAMPRQQYERLLLERMHSTSRWENQPAHGFTIEDLDRAEIMRTLEEGIRRQRLEDPGSRDPREFLERLGVMQDGQLLNAAIVLFGRPDRLMVRYPQCLLRMARFRGVDKNEFIDNRQEIGHAFDLFIHAQRFWRDHLPVAGRVLPNLFERVDDPLYPPEALREALANALCHRDYSVGGGSISIAIYDDRLEIASAGALPFGLTSERLTRPHPSRPWNPLIAQAFFRRGVIEQWGRGTTKIIELAEQAGLETPEFEASETEVLVRFRATHYVPPTRIAHDLSPLQRSLLQILQETGPVSLAVILGRLPTDTPRRTVQDNLRELRLFDLVENRGKGSGSLWKLREPQST